MSVGKLPSGTRGARTPPRLLAKVLMPVARWVHRRQGNRMDGVELLYLTTKGAKSGQPRTASLMRFSDGGAGWLVVASYGGAASHPAWYHNLVTHPDDVQVEVDGVSTTVSVSQLDGQEREAAWALIVARAPRFAGYQDQTDRRLPVLRLTPR